MSRVIDERVVEMRFDNHQFEQNVSTTMSTLEKFKQSLNLSGAAKGLTDVGNAAKRVDMNGLGTAVDTVKASFSALQVIGVTALANITNSAVNAGKRIVNALTLEPVMSGFQEYETQINAVQTILANTQHKGTTLDDVNSALDELNLYADKTIYNFTEMTRNIGTFTAAGVDLETSVNAIQGIANLAAVSGSTSQQASTAMYQLSQALAAGTVKLMDWNSVVNAGMGGEIFQNALKETSKLLGTGAEAAIKANGSFRESLSTGWLTAEVLTETLKKFTTSGANEYVAEYTGLSVEAVQAALDSAKAQYGEANAIEYASKALAEKSGKNEEEIKSALEMASTAEDAATKVKTFSQLWDTLKEAAQSGWTQTWEILVGDFEEAKELLTDISDAVGGVINSISEKRNNLLEDSMTSNWDKLITKINAAGVETKVFDEKLNETLKTHGVDVEATVKQYGSLEKAFQQGAISSDILKEAVDKLTGSFTDLSGVQSGLEIGDAGEDVKQVQQALKALGYDLGEFGVDGKYGKITTQAVEAFQKANDLKITGIVDDETLAALKKTSSTTSETVDAVGDLIDGITELGGRTIIIESFKNTLSVIKDLIAPIGEAFKDIFPSITSDQLLGLIKKIHSFTESLKVSEGTADAVGRTFKGAFSIFSLAGKVIASLGKAVGDLIGSDGVKSLGSFLLDTAASIGDFFTSLNESFDSDGLTGVLNTITSGLSDLLFGATQHMQTFGDVFSFIGSTIEKVSGGIWSTLKTVFGWISENVSVGDIFAGLAGGGLFAAGSGIFSLSKSFKKLPDALKSIFGKDGESEGIIAKFKDVLDSAKEALSSFASGIKITSLVSIAIAVGILSASMRTISELDAGQIVKSLLAIGGMLAMLGRTMKSLTKTLSDSGSKGLIKAGASLVLVAAAVKILAGAMEKISGLSAEELAKGLIGIGAGLGTLVGALKLIDGNKISLTTGVVIIALAAACKLLAGALEKFGEMSWDEIGHGLTAMGGALLELAGTIAILSKVGGGKSLAGSVSILITVLSLGKLADGLKQFGSMSWDEISRGLVGMGGALAEVAGVSGVLGKLAGFSGMFGSGAIFILTQGLSDLASALEQFGWMTWDEIGHGLVGMGGALTEVGVVTGLLGKLAGFSGMFGSGAILVVIQGLGDLSVALAQFGEMSWAEIARGLTGMGGALTEVGVVTGLLGKLAGFSGMFGSGAILVVIQGLGELASALQQFSSMTWDEIDRGLVGMGGALTEVGVVTGLLGKLTGLSGLLGAGALLLAIQGLGDLASALEIFNSMTWDEIGRGLVGMGGALTEVAVISGVLGTLAGLPALLGGGAILLAVQGLGDLADALKKFGEMSWDEIGHGLTAMGGALGVLAVGGFLNTLSIIGSLSIAVVAESLGVLADSVKKWTGVQIPDGLGLQLTELSGGVLAWTFSGVGAAALWAAAEPLGVLADSVQKWIGVTVPEGLSDQLSALATGVGAFTFSGLGANALSSAAGPLGALADSVQKWVGVTVPEGLEEGLTQLADGIKAFSWAFMGGWSLSAITTPLGDLADSVSKWKGVSIPGDLEDDLDSLASGVKSFSWAFVGSWTLGSITGPLGDLATSVTKWKGVSIPSTLGEDLKKLASGVQSFSGVGDISTAASGMNTIANGAAKLSGVDFPSISSGLTSLTEAIKNFASINSVKSSLSSFGDSLIDGVVTPIKNASKQFNSLGSSVADSLIKGLKSKQSSINSSVSDIFNAAIRTINSKRSTFKTAGANLSASLTSGVSSKEKSVSTAFASTLTGAINSIRSKRTDFYNAGAYLVEGFANGISENAFQVKTKAKAMAKAALNAAEEALGIESPSKEAYKIGDYYGLGFVNAINDYGDKVRKASSSMAEYAKTGLSDAIGKINASIDGDMDLQPTIRPVIDLSNVKTGVDAISEMFGDGRSIGMLANVGAVGSIIDRRRQNGTNDDVVLAIDKLRENLSDLDRPSYTINGITYDSGSEVANAIQTLVRAAKIEGRV